MIGDEPACNQVRAFVRLQHDVRRAWHDFAVKRFAIKDDPAAALHRGSILAEDIVHRTAATRSIVASCQLKSF
jgi:hypothetical protein